MKRVCVVAVLLLAGCVGGEKAVSIKGRLVSGNLPASSPLLCPLQEQNVPLASYSLYCVTFEQYPVAGSGVADESGYFEIKNFDVIDKPFGCFVLDENMHHVADLIFESPATGVSGEPVRSGTIVVKGSVDFGTIIVDLNAKIAIVSIGDILEIAGFGEVKEPFDFTGTWKMECIEGGEGYDSPDQVQGGPCEKGGIYVYLHRFSATEKDTGKKRYGIMVWRSEEAFKSCGGVIGVTQEEINNNPEVSNLQIDDENLLGHFQFLPDPLESITNITPDVWGYYCDEASTTYATEDYDHDGIPSEKGPDGYCKDITFYAEKIRCFINCFHGIKDGTDICLRDRKVNWGDWPNYSADQIQSDPEGFINSVVEWRNRPFSLFVFEEFIYNSDNVGSFSLVERYTYWGGERTTAGQWISRECRVVSEFQMIVLKYSDTYLEGDATRSTSFEWSKDLDWCISNAGKATAPHLDPPGKVHIKVRLTKVQ